MPLTLPILQGAAHGAPVERRLETPYSVVINHCSGPYLGGAKGVVEQTKQITAVDRARDRQSSRNGQGRPPGADGANRVSWTERTTTEEADQDTEWGSTTE